MRRTRILTEICLAVCLVLSLIPGLSPKAGADLVNSDGTLRYYDELGRQADHIGLDLSQFNNQVDFSALTAQGFDFVIIRLGGRGWGGSGRLYGDRETQVNLRLARESGMKVGAYFYSTAINTAEAVEEASAALRTLDGFPLDLPVYIDMEYSGDYPNGRSDMISPGQRADIIETFCDTIRQAGYEAGLYASEGYVRFDLDAEEVNYLPLWMASYTVENRLPQYVKRWSIWQQTDTTYAGGTDGPFDFNLILPPYN